MRFIGGIDPGLTGAIAVLDFVEFKLHIFDTPTSGKKAAGGTIRKIPDPVGIVQCLRVFPLDEVAIENVHSTPNDGHVGAFTFGKVTGITIGALCGLDIPVTQVTPAKWKHDLQVPGDKKAATARAGQFFPGCTGMWARACDHGRAEAAMIALHFAIKLGLKPQAPFTMGLVNGEAVKIKAKARA